MVIDNQEKSFSSRIEQPINGDGRKIKELESNDGWKSYQFEMDDNTDKILTPDDIKNIIKDNYHFCVESISLVKEDNTEFNSGTCKAGDIIRVYINLLINENTEEIAQSESVNEYTFDNVYVSNDIESDDIESNNMKPNTEIPDNVNIENSEKKESPYKKMIENQTGKIRYGDRSKPELTLTIDDGNSHESVEAILEILAEENVKTTFFIKGDRLQQNKDLWEKAIKQGHQICCHTYSHIYLNSNGDVTNLTTGLNGDEIDITKWQQNIKRLLGEGYYNNLKQKVGSKFPREIESDLLLETEILMWEEEMRRTLGKAYLQECKVNHPFIRLPGGNGVNREKNIAVLRRLGYLSIYWSDDFKPNGVHQSIDKMKVENGGIPIFHFKGKTEQQYIKGYIRKAKANGKTFKPLTDILTPEQ